MALHVEIKKKLGSFLLDVSFDADREILALLGASGCGKSMTLKCIAGIETPDSGKIILDGRSLYDSEKHINLPPQKRRVGYLFQQYALFPNMTVEQNIMAGVREGSRAEKRAVAAEKIKALQLEGMGRMRVTELSGGQQQRVALARILVNKPEVLLLDEPFSALDSFLKWQLELELSDTLRAYGQDVIYVSHDRDEVYRLCNTVCILSGGKSEEKLGVKELFSAPRTISAVLLSGCKNISPAHREGDMIFCRSWGVALRAASGAERFDSAAIRAHYFDFASGPGENVIPCTVWRVVEDVFSCVLILNTPGGGKLRMECSKERASGIQAGRELYIYVAPEDIMLVSGGGEK